MNVRKIAFRVLRRFEKDRKLPVGELRGVLPFMKEKERAFLKELVWGVLRRAILLDNVINKYLKSPEIPPGIRVVLRIGAYQLLFMDSVPDYAAVKESVSLVENKNFKKLVNAILRKIAQNKEYEFTEVHVKYSHPKWIAEYLIENYGYENAIRIMENHLRSSPLTLRTNSLKFSRDDVLMMMEKEYDPQKTLHSPQGIVIKYNGEPEKFYYVDSGMATYQGESSQIVSFILNPQRNWKVLDIAAGYGGKTTHIAELMKNEGKIIAVDVSYEKIEVLNERARKLGVNIIETAVMDGREVDAVFPKDFDGVLVDVPCTSLGTARKNPEVLLTHMKYSKEEINKITTLQKELVTKGYSMLKKGGKLLYATCSFLKEENKNVVEYLLSTYKDAKVVDIRSVLESYKIEYIWDGFGALFLPDETLTEFYVSLIEKM